MDKAEKYLKTILKDNDIVVIGNSGGPDSMALTTILLNLRKKLNIKLIVAHVNHNVREESKDEAKFLCDFCKKNNIVFEYMVIEKYGDDNFHNEARNIRYKFFDSIIEKYSANYLMTAHHGDDLIETILMRIVRGSSLKGYGGFQRIVDKGNYKIVRPLIFYSKEEIQKYDDKHSIPYVIDKSNFKDTYTRNRYRKNVLPFLKSEEKNVISKFLKFSELLYDYDTYFEKRTKDIYSKVFIENKLYINGFKDQERIIKNRIISKILEQYYNDDLILINDSHINLINNLICSKKQNGYVNLPNNIIVYKTYDIVEVKMLTDDVYEYEIQIDEYTKLPNGHVIEKTLEEESNSNDVCRISTKDVELPLHVRTRKVGDKMALKNVHGRKKINDIFIDSKIPALERDKWPIVVDSVGKIIWIPGLKKSKFTKSKNEKCDIILRYL